MFQLPPRLPRAARAGLLALPLVVLAGCVNETTTGDATSFTYKLWVPATIILGGLAAAPLGWALREKSGRLGWGLLIGGPIAALAFGPSMYLDNIVVAGDHFHYRVGGMGMAKTYDLKYDDIKAVRLVAETSRGRRGRKKVDEFVVCEMKNGATNKIQVSGDLAKAAILPIMTQIAIHQIPISDETGNAGE